jgi:tryptophan-rich hypothetical protein
MKRPPRVARLEGSAWTSDVERDGWRHFHVISVTRREATWVVELAASCDATRRVQLNANELLTREGWQPGWVPLSSVITPRP